MMTMKFLRRVSYRSQKPKSAQLSLYMMSVFFLHVNIATTTLDSDKCLQMLL